jgi:hypothetical protein
MSKKWLLNTEREKPSKCETCRHALNVTWADGKKTLCGLVGQVVRQPVLDCNKYSNQNVIELDTLKEIAWMILRDPEDDKTLMILPPDITTDDADHDSAKNPIGFSTVDAIGEPLPVYHDDDEFFDDEDE